MRDYTLTPGVNEGASPRLAPSWKAKSMKLIANTEREDHSTRSTGAFNPRKSGFWISTVVNRDAEKSTNLSPSTAATRGTLL